MLDTKKDLSMCMLISIQKKKKKRKVVKRSSAVNCQTFINQKKNIYEYIQKCFRCTWWHRSPQNTRHLGHPTSWSFAFSFPGPPSLCHAHSCCDSLNYLSAKITWISVIFIILSHQGSNCFLCHIYQKLLVAPLKKVIQFNMQSGKTQEK